MIHFVGIDNSSLDHKVQIIDEHNKLKLAFTIENSLSGFKFLEKKIKILSDTRIAFEAPHGPLIDFLQSKNYKLFPIHPLKIKRFKETFRVSGNKNDDIDARIIAEYLRNNEKRSQPLLRNSSEIEKLKLLSIIHSRLVHNRARHKNKLHFTVRQYFHYTNCFSLILAA